MLDDPAPLPQGHVHRAPGAARVRVTEVGWVTFRGQVPVAVRWGRSGDAITAVGGLRCPAQVDAPEGPHTGAGQAAMNLADPSR